MNFELKTLDLAAAAAQPTEALIVLVPGGFKPASDALSKLIAQAHKNGDLSTKPAHMLSLYQPAQTKATRLLLVSVGDATPKHVRQAMVAAVQAVRAWTPAITKLQVNFASQPDAAALRSAVLAVADASYVYTTTKPKAEARKLSRVTFAVPQSALLKSAMAEAKAEVLGVEMAKEWANRPANHATPTMLAQAARSLARLPKISCQVLGPKEVAKLGMGSFMAVSQGSAQPLRFVVLNYSGGPKAQAPTVLVGKGITFDTGGISLKPGAGMDEMKFDMSGAASVLGVFRALGELQPAVNVVGLIPSCENMPDGLAIKPGDVVTSMSGQTIEILNTDAEGRLILCDALTYAERFKPRAVVDIATLTGACAIALGKVRSGLFASSDALAQDLMASGESSMDLCWRMPLDEEYADELKSNFADVANVGGRAGGAITAAKFLQRFAGKFDWAHLDIAGTAWNSGAAKGATGRPVGLLMNYLIKRTADKAPVKTKRPSTRG